MTPERLEERCPQCDRRCNRMAAVEAQQAGVPWSAEGHHAAVLDCEAHVVDWCTRARTAEQAPLVTLSGRVSQTRGGKHPAVMVDHDAGALWLPTWPGAHVGQRVIVTARRDEER